MTTLRATVALVLLLSSSTACVQRRHIGAPLTIVPDSSVYRYAPDPREPGAYRVRLTVRLRNHSADTVHLAGPCGASGRPAHWFLAADRDEEVALAPWACIGAAARPPQRTSARLLRHPAARRADRYHVDLRAPAPAPGGGHDPVVAIRRGLPHRVRPHGAARLAAGTMARAATPPHCESTLPPRGARRLIRARRYNMRCNSPTIYCVRAPRALFPSLAVELGRYTSRLTLARSASRTF